MKSILSKLLFAVITLSAVVILATIPAISQEEKAAQTEAPATMAAPAVAPAATPAAAPAAGTDIAIYGEVQAVNAATNTMTVLYYDEETYEEKSIDLVADAATKMQNAKVLTDIKEGDWIDATYTSKDGKNMASSVIVEKEETTAPAETAPVAESEME